MRCRVASSRRVCAQHDVDGVADRGERRRSSTTVASSSSSPAWPAARISSVVEDAQLAAGHSRGQVVEDLDQAAPVVAVVPLPAVGADAQDVAVVALRDEAELVGHEVVLPERPRST